MLFAGWLSCSGANSWFESAHQSPGTRDVNIVDNSYYVKGYQQRKSRHTGLSYRNVLNG